MRAAADAVKQVRPWTKDLSIQRGQRNYNTAKELESVLQVSAMFTSIYKVSFRKNYKASIWKIILPDCLAGICHYMRCDWLRYLSEQVKPSCEVV